VVLGTLFASPDTSCSALCFLVVDDDVGVDVRPRDDVSRYLLDLLVLLLSQVLMVGLRDDLSVVGASTTCGDHGLASLVMLLLLHLLVVDAIAVERLGIIILVVALRVHLSMERLIGRILQLHLILVLQVDRLCLLHAAHTLDELVIFLDLLLVILSGLQFQIDRCGILRFSPIVILLLHLRV